MRIVVCIKQVFDRATIRVSSRGELDTREGERVINPADLCALEEALRIKDAQPAEVIALSLGGAEVEDALREALAIGADRAVLLSDALFAGSDAQAVAYVLARAIQTIAAGGQGVDLILAGSASADSGDGQVGVAIAEMLGLPQITDARFLDVTDKQATATQSLEDGDRRISVPLPAVVTVPRRSNVPRLAAVASIMNVYSQRTVEKWRAADIELDLARLGTAGSPTVVRRSFPPEPQSKGDILTGTPRQAATALVARLRKRGLI